VSVAIKLTFVSVGRMAVALGEQFLLVVTCGGTIFSCGLNDVGQLGLSPGVDTAQQRALPVATGLNNAIMVSAVKRHAACVNRNGSVYTWGESVDGRTGVTPHGRRSRLGPQCVYSVFAGKPPAIMVACGDGHTLLLTAAGHVWGCGSNMHCQVGVQSMADPDAIDRSDVTKFTQIPPERFDCGDGRSEIAFIAAGAIHSAAVGRDNGVLWTWGLGFGGRLGHGIGLLFHSAPVPTAIPTVTFGEAIVSASATRTYTMAVTASGVVWVSGESPHCAMGLGQTLACDTFNRVGGPEIFGDGGVRSVACSIRHSLMLAQNGILWVCGDPTSFCLGRDTHGERYDTPQDIHADCFNFEPVLAVSASLTRSAAVTASGGLYTWGAELSGKFNGLCVPSVLTEDVETITKYEPQRVRHAGVPHKHIDPFGLWNWPLSPGEQLAFAMGTHPRLGANSAYQKTNDEMLACILRHARREPEVADTDVGLRNLLGVGALDGLQRQ